MANEAKEKLMPLLKKCSLAQGMSDEEVRELLASAQVSLREYPKGDIVFHEGDMPHSLYILLSGEVHILKDTFSGRRIFLSEINEPGDMFGEVYEVLKQPYDMYVEAVTKVLLLEISSDLFTWDAGGELSRSALKIQRNLMRIFARKAYFMHNKIKVLASGSLREKIVRFLFIEMQGRRELELSGSREFMAAYLAVTRPSLSRELSAMQREGILAVDGKSIKVLDMERFEEYL
ncbi:cAMP-binding domain of CRP or a regulatory subunit of cAMP-dependent protein kinases [Selenomonas ruminantium]|uniref:cAMP-binding domain of CRP or a regulatory subunit of cAMP-dependent protein kinases n=1 Tax=Selenomonas ruminantium TaxID=971 RepID=A0A1M6WDG6_SELRU|nr:Crp/Fnr family transcriptional regulator [Selenomonas ruminantium]SHK91737.1 cAMP-binding domain of CRP or a regulatory subunit of cAMP-dependent protein kinases [Selenomonas ruminantium]